MAPASSSFHSGLVQRRGPPLPAVLALWVFVTLAIIGVTAAGQAIKTARFDFVDRFIWEVGWMGWVPLTYLVLAICRRYPIQRERRLVSVGRLALYGLGVLALQMAFDFLCNVTLGAWLRGTPFLWRHLLYIAVFKAHIYYGVYWMIVGAAHALEYHAQFLKSQVVSSQLESKLANAELNLLKGQLQPHFLFNTHNAIVALMLKQDNAGAIRMLTRLSDLLRIALSRSRQQLVELREELATLRLYLDIQHERFRDRLRIEIDVPDELNEAVLPHLLLQPLVENALTHGLGDTTEDGVLQVRARRCDDSLVLTVSDNGAGFDCAALTQPRAAGSSGVGLSNTQERLQQLYGRAQSLEFESARGRGCVVTIRIPYRRSETLEPVPA